jgi:hypothetical protein
MTDKIMLIRHAEKPNGLLGVRADGTPDQHSLTSVGWARAHALVKLFDPPGGAFSDDRLAKPQRLFATEPNAASKSRRPIETLTPLSQDLRAAIDESFGLGGEEDLVKAVKPAAGVVLIAWHHEATPQIAGLILGSMDGVPARWDPTRFDLVWVFDRTGDDAWSFVQVPQMLMQGDLPTPIPVNQNT